MTDNGNFNYQNWLLVSGKDAEDPIFLKCIKISGYFYEIYTLKTIPLTIRNSTILFDCYLELDAINEEYNFSNTCHGSLDEAEQYEGEQSVVFYKIKSYEMYYQAQCIAFSILSDVVAWGKDPTADYEVGTLSSLPWHTEILISLKYSV